MRVRTEEIRQRYARAEAARNLAMRWLSENHAPEYTLYHELAKRVVEEERTGEVEFPHPLRVTGVFKKAKESEVA